MTTADPSPVAGESGAKTIVLLHGWGASRRIWKLIERPPLVPRYRLVPLDLPGTGAAADTACSSMPAIADWVAAEMERRGVARYSVLGHSMGGNVAVHLAQRYPGRVEAAVLVAPALQSDRLSAAHIYLHPQFGATVLRGARMAAGLAGWLESRMPARSDPGWTRGYMRRSGYLMSDNTVGALQAQLRGLLLAPADLAALAPSLPVLIVHGGRDSTVPVDWALEAERVRPNATRVVVYPDAMHCPMDTHTSRFCADVAEFLDSAAAR